MDEILMSVEGFMKLGWVVAIPLVVFGVLTYLFNNKFIEWVFAFIKAFFYGALGYFMWKYVSIKEIKEVDIVMAFTCIFCCIECGDNLVKVIGIVMQGIKNIVSSIKE